MSSKILYYVQHLMGVGHVFRGMRIVRALVEAGHQVDVVYGGQQIPHFDAYGANVIFLPPLRAGREEFNKLEDEHGNVVDQAYKNGRRDTLLSVFETSGHDAIITEAFPFGRRQMRFELIPLLEAAKQRPKPAMIIASVRDILQENRKAGRDRETVETLNQFFDHVLVHGDPGLIGLDVTFPLFDEISDMVEYTGIVAPDSPRNGSPAIEDYDVVVTVGGGALGRDLLFGAAGAKPLSSMRDAKWCIVTGLRLSQEDLEHLKSLISDDVVLKYFLPDLRAVLERAQLSISRCGYNTTADLLSSGCRAVISPLSDGTETEQLRRGAMLDERGWAVKVAPEEQTPERFAEAIDRAMSAPGPAGHGLNLQGAETTARIVSKLLASQ